MSALPPRQRRVQRSRRPAATRVRGRARRPRRAAASYEQGARARLRRFRQGSTLAVALTALLLFVGGVPGETAGATQPELPVEPAGTDPAIALEQAGGTLRDLVLNFYAFLPKLVVALVLLGLAWVVAQVVRSVLRKTLGRWERTDAVSAVATIAVYLAATVIAMSVLAGDARALLGSVGLIGLALSWALQTPIESFTGWFLNSMRGYYRVGDRIEVGDVFGDVYRIDVLTTTVWEAGGPGKAVAGAQPTGAMITFPNWEVLRSNVVNYSRDFPYVWDEVTVSIANESDLEYSVQVFEEVAEKLVGEQMSSAAEQYQDLLQRARIAFDVDERPRVFVSGADAWTNCTVRYLVNARKRRRLASDLNIALAKVTSEPRHEGRIVSAYPRSEVTLRRTWQPVSPVERS